MFLILNRLPSYALYFLFDLINSNFDYDHVSFIAFDVEGFWNAFKFWSSRPFIITWGKCYSVLLFSSDPANKAICEVTHLNLLPRHVEQVLQFDVNDIVFHEKLVVTMLQFQILKERLKSIFSDEPLLVIVNKSKQLICLFHVLFRHLQTFISMMLREERSHSIPSQNSTLGSIFLLIFI